MRSLTRGGTGADAGAQTRGGEGRADGGRTGRPRIVEEKDVPIFSRDFFLFSSRDREIRIQPKKM
jgi:hypothetical protein